ncbi:MAG: glycoside hydrolase family 27 protein [Bacillus sp. (in: Bacteria)]|nr:glycoside hydrolase family 27 protein [Bacillus sp. (in: firmicutes)]MCM1426773.1 glycoside hydrolase family 27 protein [Eubacterium sp.]
MDKNSFAPTPPMGWNSYDYYDTTVNEEQVKANADFMAAHLKEFGWKYVVVDIEWYANDAGTMRERYQYIPFGDIEMDEYGRLIPSPVRFPSSAGGKGFAPLADYVHKLGLKFGIHMMRGIPRKAAHENCSIIGAEERASRIADPSSVCLWNPDMYGVRNTKDGQAYYDSLLSMYAGWGVDYIKCDDICDSRLYREEPFSGWEETRMLHRAIEKCGREIVLSLSPGPAHIERAWEYCKYANMWRITDDFWDEWRLLKAMFARCELWQDHVREGCFPDCDMLPLGRLGKGFGQERETGFTKEEQKTMMTLWCMFRSPLMIGAELTLMDEWTLSLLTNRDVLAMMDKSCKGTQLVRTDKQAVWKNKDSASGRLCVALFNLDDTDALLSVDMDMLGIEYTPGTGISLYELWDKQSGSTAAGRIEAKVPAHGVKLYRVG